MRAYSYQVIEDNAGGLSLTIFDENANAIYHHFGYEVIVGSLRSDLAELSTLPVDISQWEGNEEDLVTCYNDFKASQEGMGWNVVADEDGIYPEKMGTAAKLEFEIDEE